jgi:hypothetical protein
MAATRAVPSAVEAGATATLSGGTRGERLHDIRNRLAAIAETEWLCFLDADDELRPGYFDAMAAGSADLRGPATVFVQPDGSATEPSLVPARPLEDSNYLVIGTLIRREMFLAVGGFRNLPVHEDYDLWLRCERQRGASIEQIPEAVYVVHQRPGSRNQRPLGYKRAIDKQIKGFAP